jgi:hypothetical protein
MPQDDLNAARERGTGGWHSDETVAICIEQFLDHLAQVVSIQRSKVLNCEVEASMLKERDADA